MYQKCVQEVERRPVLVIRFLIIQAIHSTTISSHGSYSLIHSPSILSRLQPPPWTARPAERSQQHGAEKFRPRIGLQQNFRHLQEDVSFTEADPEQAWDVPDYPDPWYVGHRDTRGKWPASPDYEGHGQVI